MTKVVDIGNGKLAIFNDYGDRITLRILDPESWDSKYKQIPVFELMEAVALSLNIAPEICSVSMAWEYLFRSAGKCSLHEEFESRLEIAEKNVEPDGTLCTTTKERDRSKRKVRLVEFAEWAESMRWELPEQFPRKNRSDADPQSTKNLFDLDQPFITEQLKTLIKTAEKFWKNGDLDQADTHPTNNQIEKHLQDAGFSAQKAKTGASIIRPPWAAKGRRPGK